MKHGLIFKEIEMLKDPFVAAVKMCCFDPTIRAFKSYASSKGDPHGQTFLFAVKFDLFNDPIIV